MVILYGGVRMTTYGELMRFGRDARFSFFLVASLPVLYFVVYFLVFSFVS